MLGSQGTQTEREAGASPGVDVATSAEQPMPPAPGQIRPKKPNEVGGPKGPEPTRFGDWERAGRCIDF